MGLLTGWTKKEIKALIVEALEVVIEAALYAYRLELAWGEAAVVIRERLAHWRDKEV